MSAIRRRLDALEAYPSWFYVRLLVLASFSWTVNAAESVLFVFTRRPMAKSIHMKTYAVEALGGGVLLGAMVGGALFGRIADSKGRRRALVLAKLLSLVGLVLSIVARKGYELISARILAGVGLGGELPVAMILVHELTPKPMRGRMIALLEAFTGVGQVAGIVLAFTLGPQFGWRITYLAICCSISYIGLLCVLLPESPQWLESVGRAVDSEIMMDKLERAHRTQVVYDRVMMQEPSTQETEEPAVVETVKLSALDKPKNDLALRVLWSIMAMSSYALGVYVPTLIGLQGFNMFSSWSTMVLLGAAQTLGSILASEVLDKYAFKNVLASFATFAALASAMLIHCPWNGPVVVVGTSIISVLLAANWSCVVVCTPQNFATEARGRGVGNAFSCSRLALAGGSWLFPQMFNIWRMSIPTITCVFSVLLVAVVAGLARHGVFDTGKAVHSYRKADQKASHAL